MIEDYNNTFFSRGVNVHCYDENNEDNKNKVSYK